MEELPLDRKTKSKLGFTQLLVSIVNWMKIVLLLMVLFSIYETAILIVMVPDDYRYYSSWFMRRSRLMRLHSEEIWFEPVIVIALVLQALEFVSILMEVISLTAIFCFSEFFVTAYRFWRVRTDFQLLLACIWILIDLAFLLYLVLLIKLYRQAKLDKYAYRIATPEVSVYNIPGHDKVVGVYAKSY